MHTRVCCFLPQPTKSGTSPSGYVLLLVLDVDYVPSIVANELCMGLLVVAVSKNAQLAYSTFMQWSEDYSLASGRIPSQSSDQ